MEGELSQRLEAAEQKVLELQRELTELRLLLQATPVDEVEMVGWTPEPEAPPPSSAEPLLPEPEPGAWEAVSSPGPGFEPAGPSFRLPQVTGARALAWAGGIVTVLGIVFFFVLAVNRGWIGAGARVGLGAAASTLVFAGGLFLRRRYGETHSALAAVGAGIAGGYATTLAAAVRYDLLPDWSALLVAIAIAGVALAASLRWPSELLAGIGLVGAAAVPALLAIDVGITRLGAGFLELVFAAAMVVALARRWQVLLVASAVVAVPQIAVLVAQSGPGTDWGVVVLASLFGTLVLAAGLASQLRAPHDGADPFGLAFVVWAAVGAFFAVPELFDSAAGRGGAYLAVGVVYAVLAAVLLRRNERFDRDLSSILAALALTIGAIAVGDLLSGQSLAMTWAGEAAVLAWIASRLREPRYYAGSLAYLALAIAHALILDAPPRTLFVETAHPAHGGPTLVLIAGAAFVLAALLARAPREDDWLEAELGASPHDLAVAAAAVGTVFAGYAASLGILALPQSFAWGHTAVDGLWSLAALVFLVAGVRRSIVPLQIGGLAWLGAAAVKTGLFEVHWLGSTPWAYSFLIVGAAALLCGFLPQVLVAEDDGFYPVAPVALALSAALWIAAVVELVPHGWLGAGLLAVAGVYGAFAALAFPVRRLRDLSSLHWATGLAIAAPAAAFLLSDTLLVLAWTATAAALSVLSRATRESRLQAGALGYLLCGFFHTVVLDASPNHLFAASRHPASGLGALALVVAAGAVFAACLPLNLLRRARIAALAAVGVLTTYGASLAILELFEAIGSASVHTNFQRGHTGVSALWGVLGLVLLYLGLTRQTGFRIAGFALFGASLAKLFLYDLTFLSSVARALSFLAVGAVLLLGGFFYQRLTAELGEPEKAEADGGVPLAE